MPNPFPQSYYIDYLNTPRVQTAIGAYVNYSESSSAVGNAFGSTGDDDREIGTVAAVQQLLAQNISVTMYFGDADYNCNWMGGQVVATHVNAPGYADAGFANISTSDGVVHGQVRQAGKFAFVRIYESGHLVPFFQPLAALELVDRTINGMDVASGKTVVTPAYLTQGPGVTSFREGNHTVQFKVTPEGSIYNTTTNLPQGGGTDKGTGDPPKKRAAYNLKEARRMKLDRRTAKAEAKAKRSEPVNLSGWLTL
jgi:carboxypeptidase D